MAAIHRAAFTQSRPWTETEFAALLVQDSVFAVGDATGFALVRVIVDEAELLTIAVHPQAQRQGQARRLMQAWHDAAVARGAHHAFLEVAVDNTPARALYHSCAYTEAGLRRAYYARRDAPSADAVIMTRDLTLG